MTRELLLQLHIGAVLFALCLALPIAALLLAVTLLERLSLGVQQGGQKR